MEVARLGTPRSAAGRLLPNKLRYGLVLLAATSLSAAAAGLDVSRVVTHEPDLEDAFLELYAEPDQ